MEVLSELYQDLLTTEGLNLKSFGRAAELIHTDIGVLYFIVNCRQHSAVDVRKLLDILNDAGKYFDATLLNVDGEIILCIHAYLTTPSVNHKATVENSASIQSIARTALQGDTDELTDIDLDDDDDNKFLQMLKIRAQFRIDGTYALSANMEELMESFKVHFPDVHYDCKLVCNDGHLVFYVQWVECIAPEIVERHNYSSLMALIAVLFSIICLYIGCVVWSTNKLDHGL